MREDRFQSLPTHFIDTSVLLGAFSEKEDFYYECKNYLGKVGYNYKGFIPTSVVGEIFMIAIERMDRLNKFLFFDFFSRVVSRRRISFIPPNFVDFKKVDEIREADYEIEPLDAEHLSIAVSKGADVFVTLDLTLVGNRALEKTFRIKILHPKRL